MNSCVAGALPRPNDRKSGGNTPMIVCCFPFTVADCTDFSNKNVPTREQMENIALIIPTKPARKAGGFARTKFNSEQEMDEEELVFAAE